MLSVCPLHRSPHHASHSPHGPQRVYVHSGLKTEGNSSVWSFIIGDLRCLLTTLHFGFSAGTWDYSAKSTSRGVMGVKEVIE